MLSVCWYLTTGSIWCSNKFAQHVMATNLQHFSHIRYSKCTLLALMHALNGLEKLRIDLSMGSCGKSFQIGATENVRRKHMSQLFNSLSMPYRTGKCGTRLQGWKMQDWKMWDQYARVERNPDLSCGFHPWTDCVHRKVMDGPSETCHRYLWNCHHRHGQVQFVSRPFVIQRFVFMCVLNIFEMFVGSERFQTLLV